MDLVRQSSLRALAVESLLTIGGKRHGDSIAIPCPWHSETKASLFVHIGHKIIPGSFHCFGCNEKGNWNKLARVFNLPLFDFRPDDTNQCVVVANEIYNPNDYFPLDIVLKEMKEQLAANSADPKVLKGVEELPDDFSWRGYHKKFYEKLGGKFYWNNENNYLYFPLYMNKTYMGYTLCNLEGRDPKYLNITEARKVFLLYDYIPCDVPIVLVEGHFDALRLYAEGFYPLALFGVQNWSEIKMNYVIAKTPPKIIIAMDGDQAGYDAAVKIFKDLRIGCNVDIFYLPICKNKLDPGNMPDEFLLQLRNQTDEY